MSPWKILSKDGTIEGVNSFSSSGNLSIIGADISDKFSCCCTKPCGTQTNSGGAGVTITTYDFPSASGKVKFTYQAYSIPDHFKVYNEDNPSEVFFDTGGRVSGGKTIEFFKPSGVTRITVLVDGPGGTAWTYTLYCPTVIPNCFQSCDLDENGEPTYNPIKSITVTLSATDYEIEIPRYGFQRRAYYHTNDICVREDLRGTLAGYIYRALDQQWGDWPILNRCLVDGTYIIGGPVYEWGEISAVELSGKVILPLSQLSGTYELIKSDVPDENGREYWYYMFDDSFPFCKKECPAINQPTIIPYYSFGDKVTEIRVYGTNSTLCTLTIIGFKYSFASGLQNEPPEDCTTSVFDPTPGNYTVIGTAEALPLEWPSLVCDKDDTWTPDIIEDTVDAGFYPDNSTTPVNKALGKNCPQAITNFPYSTFYQDFQRGMQTGYNPNGKSARKTYTDTGLGRDLQWWVAPVGGANIIDSGSSEMKTWNIGYALSTRRTPSTYDCFWDLNIGESGPFSYPIVPGFLACLYAMDRGGDIWNWNYLGSWWLANGFTRDGPDGWIIPQIPAFFEYYHTYEDAGVQPIWGYRLMKTYLHSQPTGNTWETVIKETGDPRVYLEEIRVEFEKEQ